jgi:hypothetical protein
MQASRQFKGFDPLSGAVFGYPFPSLPHIAIRAWDLLSPARSHKQIEHAAKTADWIIDEFFRIHQEEIFKRADEEGWWRLCKVARRNRTSASLSALVDSWPVDADEPPPNLLTRRETSETYALKQALGKYRIEDDPVFPNGQEFEYFAVLALWKVTDVKNHIWLRREPAWIAHQETARTAREPAPQFPPPFQPVDDASLSDTERNQILAYRLAGEDCSRAMEAVCWAEHLKALVVRSDEIGEEKARERISVTARAAAIARHAKNRAMKQQAIRYYSENQHKFKSMDAAAEAIAGKIVPLAFRTVRDWIGEYRRALRAARIP